MSTALSQVSGPSFFFGFPKYSLLFIYLYERVITRKAIQNQTIGEIRSDSTTSIILCQLRVTCWEDTIGRRVIAKLTQNIDPISVCELETGIPKNQVKKFHIIAVRRSETTTESQNAVDCSDITSRGRRWIIPIATAIHPNITQRKFIDAAISTAFFGLREWEYITGATALAVS
jgi:hypothetical protein